MKELLLTFFCLALTAGLGAQNPEPVNEELVQSIRKHGLEESQVMRTAQLMMDVYGPRLTGSPMLEKATAWAISQLEEWGLEDVHTEEWGPFGRSWELQHFEMHAHLPNYWPVIGVPKAWSPSVQAEEAEVIYLEANTKAELDVYKGKLKGKIVLIDTLRSAEEWFDAPARRYDSEALLDMANADMPTPRPRRNFNTVGGFSFNKYLWEFLAAEGPIAVLDRSYKGDLGTGKIRGVYLQGNQAVAPIFRAWLEPFKDLEAGTLTLSNTGGTDHLAFDAVGIPGFQFIQDPMAYFTRTHHSNMDNLDHLVEEDLKQAATIIASFVMHTAMRDELLPRKPLELESETQESDTKSK